MRRVSLFEWLALAVLVTAAFVMRTRDITSFKLSPDDGQYMNSARLQSLERSTDPAQWWAEDRAWFAELVEDWGNPVQLAQTYQHSYLHQFLFRYGYRFGLSRIEALRTNGAVCGTLLVLALWLVYALLWPERRRVGLACAAIASALLVFVFQARTGWGQTGATLFFVLYLAAGWRLLAQTAEHETGRIVKLGLALLVLSVLGMGFQEMTSVYVVLLVGLALASPWWLGRAEPGASRLRALFTSRRIRAVLVSAVPVGAYTLALALFSEYAKGVWLLWGSRYADVTWLELRAQTLERFWKTDELLFQISVPVVLFALVGFVVVWRRDRTWFKYLATWLVAAGAVFFLAFENPSILRIYLPQYVVLVVFAAEGLVYVCERAAGSTRPALARAFTVVLASGLTVFLAATSWTTLFGQRDDAFFCEGPYLNLDGWRESERDWLHYLEDHRVTSQIGVYPSKEPLFVALDAGFDARLFSFDESQDTWTEYMLAVKSTMKREKRSTDLGGRYRLVAQDGRGGIGLYVLEPRAQ